MRTIPKKRRGARHKPAAEGWKKQKFAIGGGGAGEEKESSPDVSHQWKRVGTSELKPSTSKEKQEMQTIAGAWGM